MDNLLNYLDQKCASVADGLNDMVAYVESLDENSSDLKNFLINLHIMCYSFTRMTDHYYSACYDKAEDETLRNSLIDIYNEEKNHYKLALADLKKLGVSHFTKEYYFINSSCFEFAYARFKNLLEYGPISAVGMRYVTESVLPKVAGKNKKLMKIIQALRLSFFNVHVEVDGDHLTKAKLFVTQLSEGHENEIKKAVEEQTPKYIIMLNSPYHVTLSHIPLAPLPACENK